MNISGPWTLGWHEQNVLTANVSGGTGSNTYRRYWRPLGTTEWIDPAVTTQQYYFTMVWTSGVEFRVDVFSGNQSGSDTHIVYYDGGFKTAGAPAGDTVTQGAVSRDFVLAQNYPNPFNPQTEIGFVLTKPAPVQLVVFDATGREVARLVDGPMPAGSHRARFDGSELPSGVYWYRITVGTASETRHMVLLQ